MDIHKNARLSFRSREDLARFVVQQGGTRKAATAAFRVSAKTVAKWVARYLAGGTDGLLDRSSRPHHSPREFGNLAWPTSAVCFGPPLGTLMLRVLGSAGA